MCKRYYPANGSEGLHFLEGHCFRCKNFLFDEELGELDCILKIYERTMFFDVDDDEYPDEWCYVDGKPTCTKLDLLPDGKTAYDD